MNTKRLDGALFKRMIDGGLVRLKSHETELNAMNVFPVADGDTGTNMLSTLQNGVKCAKSTNALNDYLKALSSGMLLGARGNSGVILSQIFKGIYLELSRRQAASPMDMRNALIRGYKVAYESVINPVEGTMLTVAREGIEQAGKQLRRIPDLETLFDSYISNMEISLSNTPKSLPVLAEMGVLDSGGSGYIEIMRGMYEALTGKSQGQFTVNDEPKSAAAQTSVDFSRFTSTTEFKDGYCMEFILQLMNLRGYIRSFDEGKFIRELTRLGNSLVVVRDENRVKVHIHTFKPAPIIVLAQSYGEFLSFKLENMQLQHNEMIANNNIPKPNPAPAKPIAVISTANGEGMTELFKQLGSDRVIECSATMNASAEEFLQSIQAANAEKSIILPGNPNLFLAANQAAKLSGRDVSVLNSRTMAETYFALAMDIQDSTDFEARKSAMQDGINSIGTLLIALASKDYFNGELYCRRGQHIALYGGEPVAAGDRAIEAILSGISKVPNIGDKESLILFRGKDAPKDSEYETEAALAKRYPMMDISFIDGGQEIYSWMIGIV